MSSIIDFFHDQYTDWIGGKSSEYLLRLRTSNGRIVQTGQGLVNKSSLTYSTAQSKFGTGSIRYHYNDPKHTIVKLPSSITDENDITFSLWFWLDSSQPRATSVAYLPSGYDCLVVDNDYQWPYYNKVSIWYQVSGNPRIVGHQSGPSYNTWNHFAIVRHDGIIYMYLNGVRSNASTTVNPFNGIKEFDIPYAYPNSSVYFNGYMDDICFIKKALWTDNFTPPTDYLPDSI